MRFACLLEKAPCAIDDLKRLSINARNRNFDRDDTIYLVKGEKTNFVGVLWLKDDVYVSIPQYVGEKRFNEISKDENEIKIWASRLLNLIHRYHDELYKRDNLYAESAELYSDISVAQRMLENYHSYGPLRQKLRIESRGRGAVNWEKTIVKTVPDYMDGVPIYSKWIREYRGSEFDEISRIEESILYYLCATYDWYLGNTWDFSESYSIRQLREESKDAFLRKLEEREQYTFLDHELEQLRLMKGFIKQDFSDDLSSNVKGGTSERFEMQTVASFEVIFELLLGTYYENQIKLEYPDRVTRVFFNSMLQENSKRSDHRWEINDIEKNDHDIKPYEYSYVKGSVPGPTNWGINIPDVAFDGIFEHSADPQESVVVIDAKYYDYNYFGNPVFNVESIYKQFFYLQSLLKIHDDYVNAYNIFMIPAYQQDQRSDAEMEETPPENAIKMDHIGEIIFRSPDVICRASKNSDKIYIVQIDVDDLIEEVLRDNNADWGRINKRRSELIKLCQ